MTQLDTRGMLELIMKVGLGVAAAIFPIGLSLGYDTTAVVIESLKWGMITAAVTFAALYACAILENKSKWLATIVPFILIGLLILAAFIALQMQSSAG